ncbi:hypothetical protein GOBAR_AA22520 [Gossypium barbadense]|uniref:Uncharacterized protein n=1 Tax=Gossypium barbadense TaxID=3634 RepID=A0A2P5X489_GOSBA|nr:hypothetical protein GOBAR_AA22520 [Gossypium barbadense]
MSSSRGKKVAVLSSKRRRGPGSSSVRATAEVVMTNNDDPGTIHFRLGGLVHLISVPKFGVALGLYTDEFMEEEDMKALPRNIHISPSLRESTSVVNTHDAYYLWCMANAHVTDLDYFIAFAIRHQTERYRKGQMSPQGITTLLHMRMIERQSGTDPPQYSLSHSIDEEDLEDIPDDVPPQHEEPPTVPPRERPIHATASSAHLFD